MHGWDDACKADLSHRCDVTQLCINERRAVCSVLRVVHVHVRDGVHVRGVSWSEVATVPKRKSHRGLDLDLSLNSEVNIRKGWKENGGTK